MARDQAARTVEDRDVDHLAVDRERAAALGCGLLVGRDQFPGVGDFVGARREGFVQCRHEAGMDAGAAGEAEAAGPGGGLLVGGGGGGGGGWMQVPPEKPKRRARSALFL